LDADGDETRLPPPALASLRSLQAAWASKDEAELLPERAYLNLERAFVRREIQMLQRRLDDPAIQADPSLLASLEGRLADLLKRQRNLEQQRRWSGPSGR